MVPATRLFEEAPLAEVARSGFMRRQPIAQNRGNVLPTLPDTSTGSAVHPRTVPDEVRGRPARSAGSGSTARGSAAGRRVSRTNGAYPSSRPIRTRRMQGAPRSGDPVPAAGGVEASRSPGMAGMAAAPGEQPPEHLLPVLEQLLTGATDVTASQRLGMSPRTFSRRVSELLDYLGVLSRFQAGVASVNRGWVGVHLDPSGRVGR